MEEEDRDSIAANSNEQFINFDNDVGTEDDRHSIGANSNDVRTYDEQDGESIHVREEEDSLSDLDIDLEGKEYYI